MSRVNIGETHPELYQTVLKLEQATQAAFAKTNLSKGFLHLLKLRASQINQCAFCVRMHAQDAQKCGESLERISLTSAWRESDYFNAKERAALALTEEVTLISHHQIKDSVYAEAHVQLTTEEIAAVEWLAITINVWNRIAISSHLTVTPE